MFFLLCYGEHNVNLCCLRTDPPCKLVIRSGCMFHIGKLEYENVMHKLKHQTSREDFETSYKIT